MLRVQDQRRRERSVERQGMACVAGVEHAVVAGVEHAVIERVEMDEDEQGEQGEQVIVVSVPPGRRQQGRSPRMILRTDHCDGGPRGTHGCPGP